MDLIGEGLARATASLRPPPRLRLSEWIETNIRLPEGVSALPGAIRLWPYQYAIADAISDPLFERITLVKPVRVGFTTLLTGAIGSYVANEPAPILAPPLPVMEIAPFCALTVLPLYINTPVLP